MRHELLAPRWARRSTAVFALQILLSCSCDTVADEGRSTRASISQNEPEFAETGVPGAIYPSGVVFAQPSAPIDFEHDVPPGIEVGVPFEFELTVSTRQSGEALTVEVSGMPGLEVLDEHEYRFAPAEANQRYSARVLARADASGKFYLGVIAKIAVRGKSYSRAYSISIPVGVLEPSSGRVPMAQSIGESVESMPAQESVRGSDATPALE